MRVTALISSLGEGPDVSPHLGELVPPNMLHLHEERAFSLKGLFFLLSDQKAP
jgi:hypothetical protein